MSAPRLTKKGPRALDEKMPLVGQRRPALPRTDSAVPSALGGLTSGFGMGPGVPPLPWSLTNKGHSAQGARRRALRAAQRDFDSLEIASLEKEELGREELGRLVPLDSTPRSAYICGLSNSWSTSGLTERRTHLGTGFPLRCFQRLSEPDSATGQCRWSTTRTPEVRPPRSSRTRGSLPQFSYAHGG